jgi:hypothetical protein
MEAYTLIIQPIISYNLYQYLDRIVFAHNIIFDDKIRYTNIQSCGVYKWVLAIRRTIYLPPISNILW